MALKLYIFKIWWCSLKWNLTKIVHAFIWIKIIRIRQQNKTHPPTHTHPHTQTRYSLQVESASSEPSGHSGSPSHLHRGRDTLPILTCKVCCGTCLFCCWRKERKVSINAYTLKRFTQEVYLRSKGQFGCACFFT